MKLSILMPVYNERTVVERSISGVLTAPLPENMERELVIVVTPFIVRPVNDPSSLHLPTDGYTMPREIDRLLFMRQVGHGQPAVPVRIPGSAGFIVQ